MLTIPDEAERQAAWLNTLSNLTAANALEVRGLFLKMDAQGRWFVPEWDAFWRRWGEVDGPAALEHVETIGMKGYQPMLAEKILRGWAGQDAAGARAWLQENSASPWFEGALRGYLDGSARNNLDRATQDAISFGQGINMRGAMEVLAEQALRQRQLGGMVDWWGSLPDDPTPGSARREALGHIYWRLQLADPNRAGAWLAQLATTPYRPDKQIGELAAKLAGGDPAAALKWVATVPPSPEDGRYTAIAPTIQALAQRDPAGVENWLIRTPPSPLRDQGLVAYANHLAARQRPAEAERWRAEVKDQRFLQSGDEGAAGQLLETLRSAPPPQR